MAEAMLGHRRAHDQAQGNRSKAMPRAIGVSLAKPKAIDVRGYTNGHHAAHGQVPSNRWPMPMAAMAIVKPLAKPKAIDGECYAHCNCRAEPKAMNGRGYGHALGQAQR